MTFTVNDTAPAFTATLSSDTTPADLTGCTVLLRLRPPSGVTTLSVPATLVTPAAGTISHAWLTGELSQVGSWQWEAEVHYADGKIQTFPGDRPFYVEPELA